MLIAPDTFKGSLSAPEAAEAIASAARLAWPDAEVDLMPLADGGEGTLAVLSSAGATLTTTRVTDPVHRALNASWAIHNGRAIVESAEASGLGHVVPTPSTAANACTCGTGALLREAVDRGLRDIVLTVGGTATTDGGSGVLRSLGARFLDEDGKDLPCGGATLSTLDRIDFIGLPEALADVRLSVATDVDSPLLGSRGAAAVYGPQKGATPETVAALDRGLRRLHEVLLRQTGVETDVPGSGAGGGIPAALLPLDAAVGSGADLLLDVIGFDQAAATADLVVTGEGSLDDQTLTGKLVCSVAARSPVPVVAVAGRVTLSPAALHAAGIRQAEALVTHAGSASAAVDKAAHWTTVAAQALFARYQPVPR
ncbi:glycerate kinase [Amycolatopsis sp. WGS_07]|uniref:glycerate kinase n=1 Tax=Amycolatopsis sp. WGS_07 TaxID=3076764 RepID=UPI0038738A6F